MLCRHSKRLNRYSPSPILATYGHGHGSGCHVGGAATHATFNLEEEALPIEEQPLGDSPI